MVLTNLYIKYQIIQISILSGEGSIGVLRVENIIGNNLKDERKKNKNNIYNDFDGYYDD